MTVAGALRELREAPWPLLAEVLELRAYARSKRAFDQAADPYALPSTPAIQQVRNVRAEVTRRKLQAQGAQ